jgi:hypothetical protein
MAEMGRAGLSAPSSNCPEPLEIEAPSQLLLGEAGADRLLEDRTHCLGGRQGDRQAHEPDRGRMGEDSTRGAMI